MTSDFNEDVEPDDTEVVEEEPGPEDILMYSAYPGPRLFILNTADGTNLLGLVLDESDDSFLVGLPSRAITSEAGPKIVAYNAAPYLRLMKTSLISVMYIPDGFLEMFMQYVTDNGRKIYPEVYDYLEAGETDDQPADTAIIASLEPDVGLNKEAAGEQVQGMSDDELKKYLADKYNNGELSSGSRKKQ